MHRWRTDAHTQKSALRQTCTHTHTRLNDSNWNPKCWVSRSENRKKVLKCCSPEHPKTLLLTFIVCLSLGECVCVCACTHENMYKYLLYFFLHSMFWHCCMHMTPFTRKICTRRAWYCLRAEENVSLRIIRLTEEAGRAAKLQRTLHRPHPMVQNHSENKWCSNILHFMNPQAHGYSLKEVA